MSSQRRKGFRRRGDFENPKRFIVIAMEGAETEPRYFNELKPSRESVVQIKLVPNPNHKSSPKEVFQRLKNAFKAYSRQDEGWLVIDRDAHLEAELVTVHRDAREAGFKIAMSNPCFELWLYFHLRDPRPFNDRHDCQRRLAEVLPDYSPDSKGKYDARKLLVGLNQAIRRAKNTDTDSQDTWPRHQATRVYQLIERILGSV